MIKTMMKTSVMAMLLSLGQTAFSKEDKKVSVDKSTSEQTESVEANVSQNSRRAYIDPVTGGLTSTPPPSATDQASRVFQSNTSTLKPIEVIDHPGGMTQINLNGHARSSNKVSIDCNGKVVSEHKKNEELEDSDCGAER